MRILFVLEHYHPYIGGAEKLFQNLAESLAASGARVQVVTTRFDRELSARETVRGVEVIRVRCFNRYLFTFFSLPAVIRAARSSDLVHTTTYNAALPAWLGARLTGRRVIVTFHEYWGALWHRLPFASHISRLAFYLYEQLIRRLGFDHFVAVSEFTRKALRQAGIPDQRISRIYNGLDYTRFTPYTHQPPPGFTMTYFGRLGISKGLDVLIPAAGKFLSDQPDARLNLIIPRAPRGMYRQVMDLVRIHDTAGRIQVKHELSREELYDTVCRSSAVVIPSYSEGFCFVAAETVALGVPVISSGRGALPEVVGGSVVVCKELSVSGLLAAMEQAASGDWEQLPVKRYELSDSVRAYQALYRQLQERDA